MKKPIAYVHATRGTKASVKLAIYVEVPDIIPGTRKEDLGFRDLTVAEAEKLSRWLHRSAMTALNNALRPRGRRDVIREKKDLDKLADRMIRTATKGARGR